MKQTATFQNVKSVLLDIEGTVSDVRFVYDVMFPYAKRNMGAYLFDNWEGEEVQKAIVQVSVDAGIAPSEWLGAYQSFSDVAHKILAEHLNELMRSDSKSTGLKMLQGLVWKDGFESGEIEAVLFPDVVPFMNRCAEQGIELRIYSSGSVLAQKLFFGYTSQGDLTEMISGFYDTTVGKKQDSASYELIRSKIGLPSSEILFASDVGEELIAAEKAGMQVVASVRQNNKPLSSTYTGPTVLSFDQICLE